MDNFAKCGLLVNDISDHLPIFEMLFDTSVDTLDNRRPLMYREKSFSNIEKFKNELTSVNWTELPNYNDPYNAYGGFVYQFTTIYNNCFPLKRKKATRKNCLRKPWITSGLLKSIKKKNILYKRFLNNPTADRAQRYKNFKNKLNHCLRVLNVIIMRKN